MPGISRDFHLGTSSPLVLCVPMSCDSAHLSHDSPWGRGGGVLPYKRLIGMCRWMGSHFHDWIDYNGVAFSIDLLEWGRKFSDFGGK